MTHRQDEEVVIAAKQDHRFEAGEIAVADLAREIQAPAFHGHGRRASHDNASSAPSRWRMRASTRAATLPTALKTGGERPIPNATLSASISSTTTSSGNASLKIARPA